MTLDYDTPSGSEVEPHHLTEIFMQENIGMFSLRRINEDFQYLHITSVQVLLPNETVSNLEKKTF